jgi:hypothetical protein
MKVRFKPVCRRRLDPEQLRRGIEVELEHVYDRKVARIIASAHLCEFPTYYAALEQMEKRLARAIAGRRRR